MCIVCEMAGKDHNHSHSHSHSHSHTHEPVIETDPNYQTGSEDYTSVTTSKPFYDWAEASDQITRWDAKWGGGDFGTGATASYSFSGSSTGGFFPMTASARALAIEAMRIISEVANLNFSWADNGNVNTSNSQNGDIVFNQYGTSFYGGGYAGWSGTSGGGETSTITGGTVNLGGENLSLFLHEIGHAIGLAHPGDYNGSGNSYGNNTEFWNDTEQYTVMSYWSPSHTGGNFSGRDATNLMLYDIAALQKLYGANLSTRSTDTVYGFKYEQQHDR